MSYIPPILTLRCLKPKYTLHFALQEGFQDGYANDVTVRGTNYGYSNPPSFMWKGGKFAPINVEAELAVGVPKEELGTADILLQKILWLYQIALPSELGAGIPNSCVLSIGSWYSRPGFVEEIAVNYKNPYTPDGKPMRADVSFRFVIDFTKYYYTTDKIIGDPDHNPVSGGLKWKMT